MRADIAERRRQLRDRLGVADRDVTAARRGRTAGSRVAGGTPVLGTAAVEKYFGGLRALAGVSLSVYPGEIVGLIGPNGSGKSTMINCISGTLPVDGGGITYRGRDVGRWPAHARSKAGIVRTFQQLGLFPSLSVAENLRYASEVQFRPVGPGTEAVWSRLGLDGLHDAVPGTIPFGIGRLVELGRALATGPSVILLDEPASGLDTIERKVLADVLVDQVRGSSGAMSAILVEHDVDFVMAACDYVYVLDFGALIGEGTPEQVQADEKVRRAYLGEELDG